MKKKQIFKYSTIFFSSLLAITSNSQYYSIIKNGNYNLEPYTDIVTYDEWINNGEIYNCYYNITENDLYYGTSENQIETCQQKQSRQKTIERTFESGKLTILNYFETKIIEETTNATIIGTHTENSCDNILNFNNNLYSGSYRLKLDNGVEFEAYCNMTENDGGWTLVMSQLSSGHLSSIISDVNPQNFTQLNSNFRWGNDKLKSVSPTVAWMFIDDTTTTYFNKTCLVDLTNDLNETTNECSVAYSDRLFSNKYGERVLINATKGIGQNNGGLFNSARIYISVDYNSYNTGDALPSDPTISRNVKLWFR